MNTNKFLSYNLLRRTPPSAILNMLLTRTEINTNEPFSQQWGEISATSVYTHMETAAPGPFHQYEKEALESRM